MAKTATKTIVRYRAAPQAAPIVRYRERSKPKTHTKGRRKQGGHSLQKTLLGMIVGGFALGFIDKSATAIPTIPVLGKAGTIAAGAYFLGKGSPNGILMDVAKAAAAVAAYEYGSKGAVSGVGSVLGEDSSLLASQV